MKPTQRLAESAEKQQIAPERSGFQDYLYLSALWANQKSFQSLSANLSLNIAKLPYSHSVCLIHDLKVAYRLSDSYRPMAQNAAQ